MPVGEGLLDHPAAGPDGFLIQPENRKRDDHGRGPMTARGGPPVDQAEHEGAKQREIEGRVLHIVHDDIGPGLGE